MGTIRVGFVLVALTLSALPAAAADAPKVLSVLSVKVKGDPAAYLQRLKQYEAVQKRLDTGGTMRVWRATMAGPSVGMIFVSLEFANLEAFAKAQTKLHADPEATKLRQELDASGMREVVDSSLFVDVTP